MALDAESGTAPGLTLGDCSDLGKLMLRVGTDMAEMVGRALGLALPDRVNRANAGEARRALRLGPDEYLLVMRREQTAATLDHLREALAGRHHALVDISARLVALELAGPPARDTLAAACPLDLHPAMFGPGQASRTVLGKAVIILDCLAIDHFRLMIDRSFAPYARRLLSEAGREFKIAHIAALNG